MFERLTIPQKGSRIQIKAGEPVVPDHVIVPFIEGDGIGPDITRSAQRVLNAALEKTYHGKKKIEWFEIFAGGKAQAVYGEPLPKDTVRAILEYKVAIKGPLTTPVGGGFRSLNVTLRQVLDLYACVRPVRYIAGSPSPVKEPQKMDVVIFRENTEDVYSGIEWPRGSREARALIGYLAKEYKVAIREDSGIGIKPISEYATKRLVRMAIRYALTHRRRSITLVHKGNIMKYTEGAFRDWGYEVAREEFFDVTISEEELYGTYNGRLPEGKVVIKDRLADSMFQQVLTRADEYDVIALPNLNGDYLSDACAAQVGGLGIAPGANIGDEVALFEATHGSAPKYAGQDKVNPSSLILSGAMMFEHLGWAEAANCVIEAMTRTIQSKQVTYDFHRQLEGATLLKCSEFAQAIVHHM
ncbi:MAG: isocitrate dehydrogenase (NADP(+)) [Candidatus Omnitrophica bacterium]|nr:isocitrate dehydrogenase (NADP(+)) [Candidatus Omnitrophota bacterium]